MQVRAVGDDDWHRDGERLGGQREVVEPHVRQARVGHDGEIAGRLQDLRRAPADVGDPAAGAVLELDQVADPDRLRDRQVQPGEQIRQRRLQRQGDGERADAEGGEQRLDFDPGVVEDQHGAGQQDRRAGKRLQQRRPCRGMR